MVKAPSSLNSNIATGCLLDTSSLPAILVAVAAAPIALWGSWVPAVITGLILLIIDASSPLQQHVKLIIQNVLRRQLVTVQEQSSTQTYQDAPLLQCVIHSSQETSFVVREAEIHDVNRLQELYMQNYVMSHSRQYSGLISSPALKTGNRLWVKSIFKVCSKSSFAQGRQQKGKGKAV